MKREFIRLAYGLSDEQIMKGCRISKRTLQHWKRNGIPEKEHERLMILAGNLPWDQWLGWKIDADGRLCDPQTTLKWNPGELRGTFWRLQSRRIERAENQNALEGFCVAIPLTVRNPEKTATET